MLAGCLWQRWGGQSTGVVDRSGGGRNEGRKEEADLDELHGDQIDARGNFLTKGVQPPSEELFALKATSEAVATKRTRETLVTRGRLPFLRLTAALSMSHQGRHRSSSAKEWLRTTCAIRNEVSDPTPQRHTYHWTVNEIGIILHIH